MNKLFACIAAFGALGLIGLASCQESRSDGDARRSDAKPSSSKNQVERGRYLVTIGGCSDCHTPFKMGPKGPEPDMTRFMSGHPQDFKLPPPPREIGHGPWMLAGAATNTAFAGPWGVSYAMNLTADPSSAFSAFTEEIFINAMRTGKHFGESRPIAPPMPWQALAQASDADLKAMYAYLKTIPPVKNRVPEYQPPK
jgi:mono/diheme cytochrome c family protein